MERGVGHIYEEPQIHRFHGFGAVLVQAAPLVQEMLLPQQAEGGEGKEAGLPGAGVLGGAPEEAGGREGGRRALGSDLQKADASAALHLPRLPSQVRKPQGALGIRVIKTPRPVAVEKRALFHSGGQGPSTYKVQFRQGKLREDSPIFPFFQGKHRVSPQGSPHKAARKAGLGSGLAGAAVQGHHCAGAGLAAAIGQQAQVLPLFQQVDRAALGHSRNLYGQGPAAGKKGQHREKS